MQKLAVLIVCLLLAGCGGFQLRGAQTIPSDLRVICITPYEPYEPLQRTIRARLAAQRVKIVTDPKSNPTVLHLEKASSSEEILAISSSGEVQRYKLNLNAAYGFTTKSGVNIQRTVVRSRELSRSNNMLLSNEGEEQIVKRELLNEVAYEILRQIIAAGTP